MPTQISRSDFDESGLNGWTWKEDAIEAVFEAEPFTKGGELVASIARSADEAQHHPDLELRYPGSVHVRLTTHSAGGVTDKDLEMARTITGLAAAVGVEAG